MRSLKIFFLPFALCLLPSSYAGWTSYTKTQMQVDGDNFNDLAMDQNGTDLWGATQGTGVIHYDGVEWVNYRELFGDLLHDNVSVVCMAPDSVGDVWFGTEAGISILMADSNWTSFDTSDGLSNAAILDIAVDKNNRKWVGTDGGGACFFNGSLWTVYGVAQGLSDSVVRAIAVDTAGTVWFGTENGISKLAGTTWTSYSTADGLADNLVHDIFVDSDNSIWFATENGVSIFKGSAWTTLNNPDSFGENIFYDIKKDAYGFYWLSTLGGGVKKYDGTQFLTTYVTGDGLIDNTVNAVAIDANNVRWFGTLSGLSRFANDAPVFAAFASPDTAYEGSAYNATVSASDVNRDAPRYSVLSAPAGLAVNDSTGQISWTPSGAQTGSHNISLQVSDQNGGFDTLALSLFVEPLVSAERGREAGPFALFTPSPNPFAGSTAMGFQVGLERGTVDLSIYNLNGALVRSLFRGPALPGRYTAVWDGGDNGGKASAAGRYIVRFQAPGLTRVRTLVFNR